MDCCQIVFYKILHKVNSVNPVYFIKFAHIVPIFSQFFPITIDFAPIFLYHIC